MWVREVEKELNAIYGGAKAKQVSAVLMPAFIGDFKKMLSQSEDNTEVTEEYRTEDRLVYIKLIGKKIRISGSEKHMLTGVSVNGQSIPIEVYINGQSMEELP